MWDMGMVEVPNSIDLKSQKECVKKKIDLAENTLKHTLKLISEINDIPLSSRSSGKNEELVKLTVVKNRLEMAISYMKFDEAQAEHFHIDVPEPTEVIKNPDSNYLL